MSVEIIYETHSVTTDNEAGIATGWLPGRLSEQGRSLAVELGRRRRDDGLAAVFVSDLTRAVDTAHLAFGDTGIPIHQDPRLRECDYGQLNGMPTARLQAERLQHLDTPWPGGQSYQLVVDQTRDLLRELTAEWDGTRLLVIAHSANRWALDHLLNGRDLADLVVAPFDWQEGWHYTLPTGWHQTTDDPNQQARDRQRSTDAATSAINRLTTVGEVFDGRVWAGMPGVGTRDGSRAVVKAVNVLSLILAAAVRSQLLAVNPCIGLMLPSNRRAGDSILTVTRDEFAGKLLPAVPAEHRAIVCVAAGCGLRWGECAGLPWDAIDMDGAELRVRQVVVELSGHLDVRPYPKSRAGRRTVPLPSFVVDALRAHRLDQHPAAELAFGTRTGTPLRRSNFRRQAWAPAVERSGLSPRLRLEHDPQPGTRTTPGTTPTFESARCSPGWLLTIC